MIGSGGGGGKLVGNILHFPPRRSIYARDCRLIRDKFGRPPARRLTASQRARRRRGGASFRMFPPIADQPAVRKRRDGGRSASGLTGRLPSKNTTVSSGVEPTAKRAFFVRVCFEGREKTGAHRSASEQKVTSSATSECEAASREGGRTGRRKKGRPERARPIDESGTDGARGRIDGQAKDKKEATFEGRRSRREGRGATSNGDGITPVFSPLMVMPRNAPLFIAIIGGRPRRHRARGKKRGTV